MYLLTRNVFFAETLFQNPLKSSFCQRWMHCDVLVGSSSKTSLIYGVCYVHAKWRRDIQFYVTWSLPVYHRFINRSNCVLFVRDISFSGALLYVSVCVTCTFPRRYVLMRHLLCSTDAVYNTSLTLVYWRRRRTCRFCSPVAIRLTSRFPDLFLSPTLSTLDHVKQ